MNEADKNRDNVIAVKKFKNKADADAVREQTVQHLLYWVVDNFKQQSLTTQVNFGLLEFEAFVDALMGGGSHPALEGWLHRRSGRPPADARELRARRLIVLMTIALERTGLSMAQARDRAATWTTAAAVFPGECITAKAIEHWQERQPELTPDDEQVVATAIASVGLHRPRQLGLYFIGQAHFNHNPSAVIVGGP